MSDASPPAPARIGLEVHIYLRTQAKLFCACPSDFLAAPAANAHVCETCTGQPGAKPMAPNEAALVAAVRLARAVGAKLEARTRFLRKHYFYPDMPSNYQRTSEPVATGGSLANVRLAELHVEEDPGAYDPATGTVDYNRAGAPLIELVTEPDLDSPEHARRFLGELRLILDHLGVGRGDAGLKADCNVSVAGGERVEVKNVNSTRNVEAALAHEVQRQREAHASGEAVVRETRHFDETTGRTRRMRLKESEADYRYLPDPDLAPLDLDALARSVPEEEAPLARRARIAQQAGVPEEQASPIIEDAALADAYDRIASRVEARAALEFLLRDVRGEFAYRDQTYRDARVAADDLADLLAAREAGRVTPQVATQLLRQGLDEGGLKTALEKETRQAGPDAGVVRQAARQAVANNPKAVADYRDGKQTAVNFLVGQTMRVLKGRAEVNVVREAVEAALEEEGA